MQIGDYPFSIPTAAYQSLRLVADYRWAQQDRLSTRPAQQWIGPGADEITLPGTIHPWDATLYPEGDGWRQVALMRDSAAQGLPLLLVSGLGEVWGRWVITRVEETRSGRTWRGLASEIRFSMTLRTFGEDSP